MTWKDFERMESIEHLVTILEIHFQWRSLSRWKDSWEKKENVELAFLTTFEINNLEVKCQILLKKKMLEEREMFTVNRNNVQAAEKNNPRLWMSSMLSSLNINSSI